MSFFSSHSVVPLPPFAGPLFFMPRVPFFVSRLVIWLEWSIGGLFWGVSQASSFFFLRDPFRETRLSQSIEFSNFSIVYLGLSESLVDRFLAVFTEFPFHMEIFLHSGTPSWSPVLEVLYQIVPFLSRVPFFWIISDLPPAFLESLSSLLAASFIALVPVFVVSLLETVPFSSSSAATPVPATGGRQHSVPPVRGLSLRPLDTPFQKSPPPTSNLSYF